MCTHTTKEDLIYGMNHVAEYVGISKSTIYKLIRLKKFPKPVRTKIDGKVARAWKKQDLDDFQREYYTFLQRLQPQAPEPNEIVAKLTSLETKLDKIIASINHLTQATSRKSYLL